MRGEEKGRVGEKSRAEELREEERRTGEGTVREERRGKNRREERKEERREGKMWQVVTDIHLRGGGGREYISGLEGSQAVPVCPAYDSN
jgi:hypothetical protein